MAAMAGVPELTKVVAFLPDGTAIRGTYDGYGRVDGVDLNASGQFNDAKFVLLQFINEDMIIIDPWGVFIYLGVFFLIFVF